MQGEEIKMRMSSRIRSLLIVPNDKIDENFLCSICQELLIQPSECEGCQNNFCQECLEDWKKKQNSCPLCKKINPIFKTPHRYVRNALSQYQVKCENEGNGCQEKFNIESIQLHFLDCKFQSINCPNQGCSEKILKKQLSEHQNICKYQLINCDKCNLLTTKDSQEKHNCLSELLKKIMKLEEQNQFLTEEFKTYKLNSEKQFSNIINRLNQLETKNNYICQKNHPLVWTQGSFGLCCNCNKPQSVVRYSCQQCNVRYCQRCKPPKIGDNKGCPLGHILTFSAQPKSSIICDICNLRLGVIGTGVWSDRTCDFDLCENCLKGVLK